MDSIMNKYKKIIVWGAKFDTGHTHAFIHASIVRACEFMQIPVYWLDNRHNLDETFFDDAIIITEQWLVFANGWSNRLPLRKSSCYVIHYLGNKGPVEGNPGASMYLGKVGKLIDFRFASDWGIGSVPDKNYAYKFEKEKYINLSNGVSFLNIQEEKDYSIFYSIWGTDLLPHEINFEDRFIKPDEPKYAFFGGTIREDNKDVFTGFIQACKDNNIEWRHNCPWKNPLSIQQIRNSVLHSYIALDCRPNNHLSNGYISCRIMKNISYGKLGLTNSKETYDFFNGDVAFHEKTYDLFAVAMEKTKDLDMIKRQMINVRDNHTYINRVNDIILASEYQ